VADPEDDDDGAPESPPEGATCAVHGERLALSVCPTCSKNACMQCWHPTIRRCHACLLRDVDTIAPKIAWEDSRRGIVSRLAGTLLSAFSPDSSAAAFARGSDTNGGLFALLTFTPLALLCGIIPFTRRVLFDSSFRITLMGEPSHTDLAWDVAIASIVGFGVALLVWAAVAVPYVSLSRAYADRGQPSAPVRLMMYRGWLVPAFALLFGALPWTLPAGSGGYAELLAMVPLVLLIASMRSVARMGSGAGPIASIGIIVVPFLLMQLTCWIAISQIMPFMPDQAALAAAAHAVP
jgi:hypothetical protein